MSRVFVVGTRGKAERINLAGIEHTRGWRQLIADIEADERKRRAEADARAMRPTMPAVQS